MRSTWQVNEWIHYNETIYLRIVLLVSKHIETLNIGRFYDVFKNISSY